MTARRLRLGMVGGGEGAFIGGVHRMAARLDGQWDLVAGAFQSDPARSRAFGETLGLDAARCYGDYAAMARAEAARADRIDAVAIVTPNHLHVPVARAFLEAGIPVICDKPLAVSTAEAEGLAELVKRTGLPFVLTHNYSGYAMVRQARAMVEAGELGKLRVVQAEYAQDWLASDLGDNKQADWRGDPRRAGPGGALGDIATHAFHLAEFVSGCGEGQIAHIQFLGHGDPFGARTAPTETAKLTAVIDGPERRPNEAGASPAQRHSTPTTFPTGMGFGSLCIAAKPLLGIRGSTTVRL